MPEQHKGFTIEVKGDHLIVVIDLKSNLGRSNSGKTTIIATSAGNMHIDGTDGAILGLNCYRK